jgi:hypothetical protein
MKYCLLKRVAEVGTLRMAATAKFSHLSGRTQIVLLRVLQAVQIGQSCETFPPFQAANGPKLEKGLVLIQ